MKEDFQKLEEIVKKRRTLKVRSKVENRSSDLSKSAIENLFELAAMAPFHLPSHAEFREGSLTSLVPWRYFVYDQTQCAALAKYLKSNKEGLKSVEAICEMLNVCDFMALPVWLPFELKSYGLFDKSAQKGLPTLSNLECIAAASASVQNLLLGATALGRENYWYTGGIIRNDVDVWKYLDLPIDQKYLLGAVFVFPKIESDDDVELIEGSYRNRRGALKEWMQWSEVK